jgi:hypothetical protein
MIMQDKIIEYIRQNRDTYTRKAITEQLINTGYSEFDIEAAYKQLDEEEDQRDFIVIDEPPRRPFRSQAISDRTVDISKRKTDAPVWWDSTAFGFVGFLIGTPAIILILGAWAPQLALITVIGVLFLALFLPSVLEENSPRLADGVKYAARTLFVLFIVLPFIAGVIIAGICITGNARSIQVGPAIILPTLVPRPTLTPMPTSTPFVVGTAQIGNNRGELQMFDHQAWTYVGQAGETLTIRVNADLPAISDQIRNDAGLDTVVTVMHLGILLAENDDRSSTPHYTNSLIQSLTLPTDGSYQIIVRSWSDTGIGTYTLVIESDLYPTATPEQTSEPRPSRTPTP